MLFRILFIGFASFIVWAVYTANMGHHNMVFDYAKSLPYGDKIGHFFLMGLLAMFANLALNYRRLVWGKRAIWLGTVLVATVVVIEEFTQIYVPIRTFDLGDLAADFLGITFFSWVGFYFLYRGEQKV